MPPCPPSSLAENLAHVQQRIARACALAGRDPAEVTLLAVSKNHPPATVACAFSLGVTWFGENRIQEARAKIPACPGRARWHFIGHLQSNKARDAVALFEMIESLDSLELAAALQKQAERQARTVRVLAEINVAGESSKFGWHPDRFLDELIALNAFPRLELHGLMTVAPWSPDPERARPVFRRLRELRDKAADRLGVPLPVLSMGMSGDLEPAIAEGATWVRVGTALFGARPRPARPSGEGDEAA
ncbi:MAG: YggS family pyridoxal phosphate-dependent enzyme [Verrucomicrobiae bacterium]|nr:YggS family pyridoxal phosphate-dependent enzyme [Verrucomicrobiae bacterium]